VNTSVARIFVALVLPMGLAAVLSCSSSSPGVVPEHPDLTGTWLINAEMSQDPEENAPRRGTPPPGGGPPGASRTRAPAGGESFMPSVAFRLSDDDSVLVFSDAQGRDRIIYQDGREFTEPVEGLGNLTVTAEWKGDKLVIERQLESGPSIIETYQLSEDGRQLHIEIKIVTRRTIRLLRVYDRGDAGY
jgi:hypothetical protein